MTLYFTTLPFQEGARGRRGATPINLFFGEVGLI